MSVFVTDTHPLVWYSAGAHARLSRRALRAFDAAVGREALIYVPALVLWEVTILIRIGRVRLRDPFASWAARLVAHPGFELAPLDVPVLAEAAGYALEDPFDGAIVATARVMDLPLITRDQRIVESRLVDIHW